MIVCWFLQTFPKEWFGVQELLQVRFMFEATIQFMDMFFKTAVPRYFRTSFNPPLLPVRWRQRSLLQATPRSAKEIRFEWLRIRFRFGVLEIRRFPSLYEIREHSQHEIRARVVIQIHPIPFKFWLTPFHRLRWLLEEILPSARAIPFN